MSTKFRTIVFLFAVLALSGVALAQQAKGTGGLPATLADAILQGTDHGRVRLTRAPRLQYAETGCSSSVCNEPPRQAGLAGQAETVAASDTCSSLGTARDRNGRAIRRLCTFN
uniref:Uncharacterized protein n=1 Tax=Bosea sp. NBC_00436 TaxID=2969620 RepID=A0A9E8A6X2_9HYPH